MMHAAVYQGNSRVTVEAIPVPSIGPGELLVRVESCGICHTDLHVIDNDWGFSSYPVIPGHEIVGQVVAKGSLVAGLALVKDKRTAARFDGALAVGMVCRGHCFRNGLVMRAVGDRMIIAPPLTMTHEQIDEMMALITRCLDLTLKDAQTNGWLA